jgi:hypothetical protein
MEYGPGDSGNQFVNKERSMVRMIRSSFVVALMLGAAVPAFAQPKKAATDDLSLLPVDSEMVMGLDFQQLQTSALWKQFVEPQLGKASVKKQFDDFKTKCNVDAMKVVTKIAIGVKGLGSDKPDGVIVAHGVPKAKLVTCYPKLVADKKADVEITRDGDILIIKEKGKAESAAFTFLDDSTALFAFGTIGTKDGITKIAKGTSALKTSAAFVEFYKKTSTTDTLWMIMNGNSKAFDQLASMGIKPKAVYGSVNVTKDLNVDMRMRLGSADEAKNLANMFNGQIKQFAAMFDKIEVKADGADMRVAIMLTDAKLKALAKQFGGMMGKP